MNSKMVHDTEDKIAYNFFESVINLRESIAEAIRYMYNLSITDQSRLGNNSYRLWKQFFDLDYNLEILGRELQKIMREE